MLASLKKRRLSKKTKKSFSIKKFIHKKGVEEGGEVGDKIYNTYRFFKEQNFFQVLLAHFINNLPKNV